MAKVIGYDENKYERFTCYGCKAIVTYVPNEEKWNGLYDEGQKIMGLSCPGCGEWHRTNP